MIIIIITITKTFGFKSEAGENNLKITIRLTPSFGGNYAYVFFIDGT